MKMPRSMTLAALTISVAAVGNGPAFAQSYTTDAPPQTIAAGAIGGGWFIMATALFDLYDREIGGLRFNTTPGGGVANPIAVQTGQASIAFSYNTNLFAAYNGMEPYEGEHGGLRGVMNFNSCPAVHPWFAAESGVTSFADLRDQRPAIRLDTGSRGTGGELAAARMLAAHGITYDDIRAWGGNVSHSNYREAIDRMKDGHIDSFTNDDLINAALYQDMISSRDVVLLAPESEAVAELTEAYGYGTVTIPAGTYPGQDTDVTTTIQCSVMFAHEDVPEDLVYAMTKLAFEHIEDLRPIYGGFEDMQLDLGPVNLSVPLHPGAERYYREAGVLP